ncbi:MAG TPA: multidrug ABC transporter ATP-binding protein [Ruminococcaceae bacterium]|nr:multidrug ABC transporter ATP-binding protein [Oscillospiraceae bacterium]
MRKLLQYLKPYKNETVLTMLLHLIGNAMTLALPLMMSLIINKGINNPDHTAGLDYIKKVGLLMLALSAFGAVVSVTASYFSSKASMGFGANLRRAVFRKVEALSECDLEKIGTPSLITRTTTDINRIQETTIACLNIMISIPIMLIGGTVMSIVMNRKLALAILVVIPVVALITYFFKVKVIPLFKSEQKKTDTLNKILREKLSGIRVIRAFNRTDYEDERFRQANLDLTSIGLYICRLFALLWPIAFMLLYSLLIGVVWIGGKEIDALDAATHAAEISNLVGDLQAFLIYILIVVVAVSLAAALFIMFPRAAVSCRRVLEILNLDTMIHEPVKPKAFPKNDGSLSFREVSFGYPGASEPVLSGIDFACSAGEVTAIIGGTGCGKSTLVNLIPRFFDVTCGQIVLDGLDLRDVSLHDLHEKIAFVPQKATLFRGTVADNLRYGKPDATEEEMWEALRIACADDFIRSNEQQLDLEITQNGTNLSGGQKQRLAIARALIKRAEVLIFDDSFSALDFKTDASLRQNIRQSMKNTNIILVAQRVGTILDADRILVLEDGKICGIGKHEELLESCSVYREIVESQLTKEDLAR